MTSILIVCTGNICRSPMAEGIFRARLGTDIKLASAGIYAIAGLSPDPLAVDVCREHGIAIDEHKAIGVTEEAIRVANLVLTMESAQSQELLLRFPWATGRIWRLGHHLGHDLDDLFGRPKPTFERFFNLASQAFVSWQPAMRS